VSYKSKVTQGADRVKRVKTTEYAGFCGKYVIGERIFLRKKVFYSCKTDRDFFGREGTHVYMYAARGVSGRGAGRGIWRN
jgi:hypothetical protein